MFLHTFTHLTKQIYVFFIKRNAIPFNFISYFKVN